jgi:hypothetical protein
MTEILWKSSAPHLSIQDHELVELRMIDLGNPEKPRYLVREIHASWSASAQQIEWRGFEDETYGSRQAAQRSFASRKASIIDAGYPYTTTLS